MLVGIHGKKQHGKDLVASMCQHYISNSKMNIIEWINLTIPSRNTYSHICVKKFADKLKDIICLILNCTHEDLENETFKNTPLGEDWIRYGRADGFFRSSKGTIMNNTPCSKEEYETELKINWQTAYKFEHTPRSILQMFGTEVGRFIHPNLWINALFIDYQATVKYDDSTTDGNTWKYPNWFISDLRFPNELEAIKKHKGLVIKVVNPRIINNDTHESETALDNYTDWDYVIVNDGTIGDLYNEVVVFVDKFNLKKYA